MAGPLGADILSLLSDPDTGLVLDSWLDADGTQQGGVGGFVPWRHEPSPLRSLDVREGQRRARRAAAGGAMLPG